MELNFEWGKPYKKNNMWHRECLIPHEARFNFFNYWKKNNLKLKSMGYSVTKRNENEWYVIETRSKKSSFDSEKDEPEKFEELSLETSPLKDSSGLRPWQVNAAEKLCAAIKKWGCAIDGSDVGLGKCHSKGTKIRMYDGTLKKVEDIVVGDKVMGDDSTCRNVLSLGRGVDDMYEIVPTNGGVTWGCNGNHILVLEYKSRNKIKEITVNDYLKTYKTKTPNWKLIRVKVDYPKTDLHIDPYLMGLWIGDGTWSSSSVTIHINDIETINFLYDYAKTNNLRIYKSKDRINSHCNTYFLRGITNRKNELWDKFKKYGIGTIKEKFIPREFLINNEENRKKLLAGIIDSDGYKCDNGCYEISTKYKNLYEQYIELARSLGYKVSHRSYVMKKNNFKMEGHTYFKVVISGANDLPVLLPRKKSLPRKQIKSPRASGFEVVPKGTGEYYGFTLDKNHRYLLEDFTVSHNTYTSCAVARELNLNILIVCPKAVMDSWERVIKNHFKMEHRLIGIINYELLRVGRKDSLIASYVKRRETRRREFVWKIPKNTLIIWDESQKLKSAKTKNSETCVAALKQGYTMLFCSATNATNPLELKTVGHAIKLFNTNSEYYAWLYEHGVTKGRFGLEFTGGKEHLIKLSKDIFTSRGVRLRRDTIPNFPESQIIAECYNMEEEASKKINKIYTEMESELKKLRNKVKKEKSTSALTAILRARQEIELVKVPLFVEMVEDGIENGMSVVVFCNFTETINALSERLNTKCIVNGDPKYEKFRQQNIDDFQNDKQRVILVNIAAGGAGLSLHDITGKHPRLSLISPSYSAVLMRQSTGRVWRDSAKSKSVQKIIFVAKTIEEKVCESVNKNLDNMDALNDGDLKYENEIYSDER